jgi:hypothetical protein
VGAVASTLYLVGPAGVCILLGWAYVDGVAAFAMIAASLSWIIWYQTGERGVLRGAALLAGFAVCFKITSALLPAALLALTCIAAIARARALGQRRIRAVDALAFSARLLPLMLLPLVPWLTRSAIVTDNPFFPLFARWIPSRDFSPDLSVKFDRFNRFMTWGNAFGRGWTIEQRTWILFGACAAVVLVCSVVMVRTASLMGRGTIAVVMVALVMQLLAAGLYVRYSVPLAAVLTLPVAAAFGSVLSRRSAPYVWLAVTLVCSLVQARRCLSQENLRLSDVPDLLRTATGLEARRTFLRDHLALYPLYEEVNRDLPKSARVMLSCYCGGFYIDRTTFCADMVQDSLRVTGWDEFTSDLRRLGITHVIAPTALANGGPSPALDLNSNSSITRESQYRVLRPLLSAHATARGIAFDQGLYEIDPALLEAPVQ